MPPGRVQKGSSSSAFLLGLDVRRSEFLITDQPWIRTMELTNFDLKFSL